MRADIVPGAIFPNYELSDQRGKHRHLSELQANYPMVLVLSRGSFCPKDRRQHEGLLQLYREMEVGYCRMVTVSTDTIAETHEFRSGVGAHWPFLSDPRRTIQKDLDIAEYTDPVHNPMIPHVVVLEPGLVVYKVYNGYWFFGRPTVEDLRQDLRAVCRSSFADWDITQPALRTAWQEGSKELFFPYGKSFAQTLADED
jgi:peroxiredoxin